MLADRSTRGNDREDGEGASQLDLLLGDLDDDDELASIEAELGINNNNNEEDFQLRPISTRVTSEIEPDRQNELAIVEEFNQKYRNDATRPDNKSIKAIFVVKFDINEGNVVEWQYPRHFDLSGVEFKAMVSGSHNVDDDIVYFKTQDHYGVSCYSRLLVHGNKENRGAIMRSIGVLMSDFTTLHEHKLFLTAQVEAMNQAPGNFGPLMAYYQESQLPPEEGPISPEMMRLNGPRGYFTEFIDNFGVHAFAIWKAILLRKRILFHSPPPIRKACRFVYAASFLAFTRVKRFKFDSNPLFYINVNDIKTVQEQDNYIACTTETILQKKFHLYDLYIKKHTIHLPNKDAQAPLNITEGDTLRFAYLDEVMGSPSKAHVEDQLLKFFIGLNNKLFQGLLVACERNEVILVNELPERFGLHKTDAPFLRNLADILNLTIVISDDVGCWCC